MKKWRTHYADDAAITSKRHSDYASQKKCKIWNAAKLFWALPYSMKFLWHFNFAVFEKPQNLSGVKFWWRKNLRLQKFHIGRRGRTLKQFYRVQAY